MDGGWVQSHYMSYRIHAFMRSSRVQRRMGGLGDDQSTFHLVVTVSSSSPLTSSSIDQITRVKNMFIHRHQTCEE